MEKLQDIYNIEENNLQLWNESTLLLNVEHCIRKMYTNIVMLKHLEDYLFIPYSQLFKEDLTKAIEPLYQWFLKAQPILLEECKKRINK